MHKITCIAQVHPKDDDAPRYYCEVQKQIKQEFDTRLDPIADFLQAHELKLEKIYRTQGAALVCNIALFIVVIILISINLLHSW